jgi:hypothetical protein
MQGISCLAEDLLALQQGPCSMELVSVDVFTAVELRIPLLRNVTLHNRVSGSQHFEEMYYLYAQESSGPRRFFLVYLTLEPCSQPMMHHHMPENCNSNYKMLCKPAVS